jgi:hypothetical protein
MIRRLTIVPKYHANSVDKARACRRRLHSPVNGQQSSLDSCMKSAHTLMTSSGCVQHAATTTVLAQVTVVESMV